MAELHAANIDQGFLATMGVDFLSLMYQAINECGDGVLLVEERNDRVIAFVSGAATLAPVYKWMLRHPFRLGLSMFPTLFHLQRMQRLIETLRYGRGAKRPLELPGAELLSIAVAPEHRGQAIAEQLYARLRDDFSARGVGVFKITVGEHLTSAHRFYRRMGALPAAEIQVHPGRSSVVYLQTIP